MTDLSQAPGVARNTDATKARRVVFEMKRPNGDKVRYGLRTRHLNVVFTTAGPVEVNLPTQTTASKKTRVVGDAQSPRLRITRLVGRLKSS